MVTMDRLRKGVRVHKEERLGEVEHDLEEREPVLWAYRSPSYRALNLRFGVRCSDSDAGAYLDHVLSGLRSDQEEPEVWYSIGRSDLDAKRPYSVSFGSELIARVHSKVFAIRMLLWHINGTAVSSAGSLLVLHAGGVALDGAGVIISGPSGSGKTTLTAALVRAGFRYLTDEAVAFDPVDGLLHPYPKALAIQSGSWELLSALRPPPSELSPKVWHVAPTDIRPNAIASPVPPSLIVFPTHEVEELPGEASRGEIARSEALMNLFRQSFEVGGAPARTLAALGTLVERCRSFRISTVDLGSAVRGVAELMRLPPAGSSVPPKAARAATG
jgi:hypothetical protein